MALHVGTSGWQYEDWRGRLYPAAVPKSRWLEHYAQRFATVEVNNAFYRLPEGATFASWASRTPDDFIVALKASRYLTHVKRLKDPAEPVGRLMERATHLGPKLGPVLVQVPETLRADPGLLDEALAAFPRGVRVAFEPRHRSWETPAVRRVLEHRGAALCLADTPTRRTPHWRTADWGYVRFHQGRARPAPCYGRMALSTWAGRLARLWDADDDLFVYFNNDHCGCAVRDARRFAAASSRAGLRPTRVPGPRETPVGEDGD